ncbi:hypothetical protein IGI04_023215 [Brassica rapa subsp. trilocularis]|uniref:Uncharacterized protein n=1 Tax=Brassica rapa subsp. trilocularis TaxID=1813537 RepID=A0ABQ7M3U4_BRACM|nr:hypothetical protein IGI04_023215 [Brassica rapa subsp. trilocularis]
MTQIIHDLILNCQKNKKSRDFSFSFAETTPKVKFSPTLPSPISDSSFSVTTFGSHSRLQFQTPNPISSSCLLLSTNPNSTPPPSIPRNLNSMASSSAIRMYHLCGYTKLGNTNSEQKHES